MGNILYHYCSMSKMVSILSGKNLRLSDITKSNDYDEVYMFFPRIINAMKDKYQKEPFHFSFAGETDIYAIGKFFQLVYEYFCYRFDRGGITNFVVCFCEDGDKLSQWRGYADNGRGCAIGFSKNELMDFCKKYGNIMVLEKVEYKTEEELNDIIIERAEELLEELKNLRQWVETTFNFYGESDKIEKYMLMLFIHITSNVFMSSLALKNKSFEEENEWRIFFRHPVHKNPKLVYSNKKIDFLLYEEMGELLRNKIEFNVVDDKLIPFYPMDIVEISENPIKEIIIGPNSKILPDDFWLFCGKYQYENVNIRYSKIPYR